VRRPLALAAVVAAAAALAVPAVAATTRTVKVGDDYFVRKGAPPTVVVRKGDTVKWIWRGRVVHNVYVLSGPRRFHSRTMVKGSYSHRMTRRGLYSIVCTIHSGMEMRLRVR
jgi:plastocyanin